MQALVPLQLEDGDPVSSADERVALNGAVFDRLPGPGDLVVDRVRQRGERVYADLNPFVRASGAVADAADPDPGCDVTVGDP